MAAFRLFLALLLATASFAAALPAAAQEGGFYRRNAEGWFWYDDPPAEEEKKKEEEKPPIPPLAAVTKKPGMAPFSLAWLRKNLPILLDRAVDNPTRENVEAYLYAQRVAMDKAQNYADKAKQVVATDPFLDENNQVPLASFAKSHFLREVDRGREDVLKHLSTVGGLWMFFDSRCAVCTTQAHAVKELGRRYGFITRFISMDGNGLPNIPDFSPNGNHAAMLNVKVVPTTVLVVPPNNYYVLSQGLMTFGMLGDRLLIAAESQNLLPKHLAERLNAYQKGVLTAKDMADGADDDPAVWIKNLKKKLPGRY